MIKSMGANLSISGRRSVVVSAIGDSITAMSTTGFDFHPSSTLRTPAQVYADTNRAYGWNQYLIHAVGRTGGRCIPAEFCAAYSGGTSAGIVAQCLPVIASNPFGKPDAVVVLAGANDMGGAYQTGTLTNIETICTTLLSMGVVPILCTLTPQAANYTNILKTNLGIARLATKYDVPLADFYSALADPSTGGWAVAAHTVDNTHPSSRGAAVMGWVLGNVLNSMVPTSEVAPLSVSLGLTSRLPNVNLLTLAAGSINTVNSYPSGGWAAPSAGMSTVFNPAGTEPGTYKTMRKAYPTVVGETVRYDGNAWDFVGDGSHNYVGILTGGQIPAIVAGHRYMLSFFTRALPDNTAGSPMQFKLMLLDSSNGVGMCGVTGTLIAKVGDDAACESASYSLIWTAPAGFADGVWLYFMFGNLAGASNVTDNLCIANLNLVDLTAEGFS